jgi:hypothetical protein
VLGGLWSRFVRSRREAAIEREAEEEQMSREEREFIDDVEGHQSEEFVAEHLGGIDPDRLLGDGEPPPD